MSLQTTADTEAIIINEDIPRPHYHEFLSKEREIPGRLGFKFVIFYHFLILCLIGGAVAGFILKIVAVGAVCAVVAVLMFLFSGIVIVSPNEAIVCLLFGEYKGTLNLKNDNNGIKMINPLYTKYKVSLKLCQQETSPPLKVNDLMGTPVICGIVVIYRVKDTYLATQEVNDYKNYIETQSDSALRKLVSTLPYDVFDKTEHTITLRGNIDIVNERLKQELHDRLKHSGLEVVAATINHLSYATEIAGGMLRSQQAAALISAREKIVEGAVSMSKMAVEKLRSIEIMELSDTDCADLVSKLIVTLVSEEPVLPTVSLSG